jgi:hypothetical protein
MASSEIGSRPGALRVFQRPWHVPECGLDTLTDVVGRKVAVRES